MKYIVTFFLLVLFSLNAQSLKDMSFGSAVVSEVTSVYDGDTFRANIKGFPKLVGHRMSIRILGIDTPEMKGKCKKEKLLARKAKKFTVSMLRSAKVIELRNIKRGKYFRLLADVYVDEVSIAQELLDQGLAVRYSGGTKKSWCR